MKLYRSRTHCPYCEQALPKDFREKKEALRMKNLKETWKKKRLAKRKR